MEKRSTLYLFELGTSYTTHKLFDVLLYTMYRKQSTPQNKKEVPVLEIKIGKHLKNSMHDNDALLKELAEL